jgi:hypothetical protein
MWVGVGLGVDRKQVFNPGQHQNCAFIIVEQILQAPVNLLEKSQNVFLVLLRDNTVSVKHRPTISSAPSRLGLGVELQLFFRIIIPERLGQTLDNIFQVNLAHTIAGGLQQPDLILAKRQHVELAIAAEYGQQWFDVETVGDKD